MSKLYKYLKFEYIIFFLFLVLCFIQIYSSDYEFNTFGDRDLIRAFNLENKLQIYGAEINQQGGKRVLGGFLYYYLYFLIQISNGQIDQIFLLIKFLNFSSLLLLFFYLGKKINFTFSSFSLIVITTSIYQSNFLNIFWNPTIGFFFINLSYFFLYKFYFDNKLKYLYFGSIINLLAIQIHFSFLIIYFFFILTALLKKISLKHYFLILFIFPLISYLPNFIYYFGDFNNSFENPLAIYDLDNFEKGVNVKSDIIYWLRIIFYDFEFIQSSKNIKFFLPFGLIILMIFALISFLKDRTFLNNSNKIREFVQYNLILFILGLLIISFGNSYIDGEIVLGGRLNRYLNFLIPVMASLSSLCILIISNSSKYNKVIITIITLFFTMKSLNIISNEYKHLKLTREIVPLELEAIKYLNTKKNYSLEKIRNDTILSFIDNKNELHHLEENSFDFYFRYKNTNFERKNSDCLAILYKNHNGETIELKRVRESIKNELLLFDKANFRLIGETKNFYYIGYNFLNNFSCQSNILNDYILLKDEEELLTKLKNTENIVMDDSNTDYLNYYYHLKKESISFKFMVKFKKDNDNLISANLISKDLRNSKTALNGIYSEKHLANPRLLFLNKKTLEENIFPFSKNIVGLKHNVTPKNIKINFESNDYELFLLADYFFDTHKKRKIDNIKIRLDSHLKL